MSKHVVRRFVGAGLVGMSALSLAACGGKPSASDIEDKLVEVYTSDEVADLGITEEQAEKLAACAAPKMEDRVSEDGLDKIMDVDPDKLALQEDIDLSEEDNDTMDAIFEECSKEFTG